MQDERKKKLLVVKEQDQLLHATDIFGKVVPYMAYDKVLLNRSVISYTNITTADLHTSEDGAILKYLAKQVKEYIFCNLNVSTFLQKKWLIFDMSHHSAPSFQENSTKSF